MIEAARKAALEEGRAVYIFTTAEHKLRMENLIGPGPHGIKVETPTSARNFDIANNRLIGAHPNCMTFVDHHLIEQRFSGMLEELHRYDPPFEDWGKKIETAAFPGKEEPK